MPQYSCQGLDLTMKDKKFITLSSLFFLLFFLFMTVVNFNQPLRQLLKAQSVSPSPLKSFIIAFPQIGPTGSKIKVSVFIRDVNGDALSNRSVKLSSSLISANITPSETQTTNNLGLAEFYLSSDTPGEVKIQAVDVASNTNIVNVPTVEFTQ